AIGHDRLLEPRRPALPLPERKERYAKTVAGCTAFVSGRSERQKSSPQCDHGDEMHVASAISSIFVQRFRFRMQERHKRRRVRAVNGLGQRHNRLGRGFAVVGRERDIALTIVEQRLTGDITLAALFLLAPHCLSGRAHVARARRDWPLSTCSFALVKARPTMSSRLVSTGRPAISFS